MKLYLLNKIIYLNLTFIFLGIKVLIKRLLTKYLEFLLEEAVVENDWENYFSSIFEKITSLSKYFDVDEPILIKHCSRKIHLLRSLKYSVAFHLGRKDLQSAFERMEEFSIEVQKLYFFSLYSNPFVSNPKYFYLDLIYSCQELAFSLTLLVKSDCYKELKTKLHFNFIKLYEFFAFFGMFFLALNFEGWVLLAEIIDEVLNILDRYETETLTFMNENFDYVAAFGKLRKLTEKVSNFKQKNKKSLKHEDLYSEIFQINYSEEYEEKFSCKSLEENDFTKMLFKIVIKHLIVLYLNKNIRKRICKEFEIKEKSYIFDQNQFSIENILIFFDEFENKSYKTLKTIFNKFGVGELTLIIEDFKRIIFVSF